MKYLVAGVPRSRVQLIDQAFQAFRRGSVHNIQLAPVCTFNAFEFSNPDAFANEAFLLVDIGHHNSTVTVGVKKEIVIVRAIDYGAVSYTHLDVYKRQYASNTFSYDSFSTWVNDDSVIGFNPIVSQAGNYQLSLMVSATSCLLYTSRCV